MDGVDMSNGAPKDSAAGAQAAKELANYDDAVERSKLKHPEHRAHNPNNPTYQDWISKMTKTAHDTTHGTR
jgi:hypothetical protein